MEKGKHMRRRTLTAWTLAGFGMVAVLGGCSSEGDPNQLGSETTLDPGDPFTPGPGGVPGGGTGPGASPEEGPPVQLEQRKRDYGESLRAASLKLVGEVPTLAEINSIASAPSEAEQKKVYEAHVDRLLGDPRFTLKMIDFWRDTLRTAQVGNIGQNQPNKDFAANFAALVTVEGRPFTDLFTAKTGTCPTFDAAQSKLNAADCAANGTLQTAGLLTDRGLMAQYFAPMAFRRVRFVQETFVSTNFPTEFSDKPVPMGLTVYTNTWPFDSVTGGTGDPDIRVNFKDTSAVNCANCHGTINHQAPLFGNFDGNGAYMTDIQVTVPVAGNPRARLKDWLPDGQQTFGWRFGKPVTDIAGFAAEMAKDPDVAACAVTRAWNYAFSRGDVVGVLATVPAVVTKNEVAAFKAGNFKFKDTLGRVFKSDDFTMW